MIKKLELPVFTEGYFKGKTPEELESLYYDIRALENKINKIIDHLPQEKEPYQKPKSNHLEVNYIAVGYYKHEIDFGVLGSVQELSDTDFEKMLDMLQTAIRVAKEMRDKKQPTKEVPDIERLKEILEKFYTNTTLFYNENLTQTIQEISALYRKESV